MAEYIPPSSKNLPFNFTNKGYSAPNSKELLFNFAEAAKFGDLRAAVNVFGKYWYETYTYTKSCPKYVVGYGSGGVQIIKGRCVYGGIRDLKATITGQAIVYEQSDLSANIAGFDVADIQAIIETHSPSDLYALVKVMYRETGDLSANIHGFVYRDLNAAFTGTHPPANLYAGLFSKQRAYKDLPALIYGWQSSDLSAFIGVFQPSSLYAYLNSVPPSDLPAYLKVWPQKYLSAYTYGWGASDLGAYLNMVFKDDISATIIGRDDMLGDLHARLKGYGSEYKDLPAHLQSYHVSDLSAILRAKYFNSLLAYVFPVLPKNLPASLHAWHARYLQGIITGNKYPWELAASIVGVGGYLNLQAIIYAIQAAQNTGVLPARIAVWQLTNLSAQIAADTAPYLHAYLNPLGYASNLHASIYPKTVRLTTVISISTLSSANLSAMINSPCFHTGYSVLPASVYVKFKSDLFAFIRSVIYDYKPNTLSAKTGYSDSYMELDTISLNFNILPNSFYTLDKYRLIINLYAAGNNLSAYIRGTLRYASLSAQATAVDIDSYTFDSVFKNRERVIHKTYDGVFRAFETIEMAFKSAVEDYYYSSDGDYVWKKNRLERWMLNVKSILPADVALQLKRRLHRASIVYDLRKFVSVDEAIRFAIAYVTEYPQSDLSAQIVNGGSFTQLGGVINPRYIKSTKTTLSSSINPTGHTVIIGTAQNISKI